MNTINDKNAGAWVFYRRPVSSEIIHISGKEHVVKNNSDWIGRHGFVIAPFDLLKHDTVFIEAENKVEIHTEAEIEELFDSGLPWPVRSNLVSGWRDLSMREYSSLFQQMKKEIDDGDLKKVVLSRVINLKGIKKEQGAEIFINLCRKYTNAFISFFYSPAVGLWLGATPEILMLRRDESIRTVSLAGTTLWRPGVSFEYLWNKKELYEQQLVTDFVRSVLDINGIEDYKVKGPETIRAGNIAHVRTIFSFINEDINVIGRLIEQLHPTPAVCGVPQERSKKLIEEVERYDRTYYAGFVGPVCKDSFSLYVNLRCLQFTKDGVQLFVGGGLTKDSKAEDEWNETQLKVQTLLEVIR